MTLTPREVDLIIRSLNQMPAIDDIVTLTQKLEFLQSADADNYVIYGQKEE